MAAAGAIAIAVMAIAIDAIARDVWDRVIIGQREARLVGLRLGRRDNAQKGEKTGSQQDAKHGLIPYATLALLGPEVAACVNLGQVEKTHFLLVKLTGGGQMLTGGGREPTNPRR